MTEALELHATLGTECNVNVMTEALELSAALGTAHVSQWRVLKLLTVDVGAC